MSAGLKRELGYKISDLRNLISDASDIPMECSCFFGCKYGIGLEISEISKISEI